MSETDVPKPPRIALLGVPIEIGASQAGTLMGPAALRTAGIARVLEQLGFAVEDHGDIAIPAVTADGPAPDNAKFYDDVKTWIRTLSERSFALASSGAIPIFMGGDHSLSMGSVNGVARYWHDKGRPLFVLWLDAHADYNTRHVGRVPVRRTRARQSARRRAARLDHAGPARSVRHPLDRPAREGAGARTPGRDRRHACDR
jgi:arginase